MRSCCSVTLPLPRGTCLLATDVAGPLRHVTLHATCRLWLSCCKLQLSGSKVVVTADKSIGKPTGVRYGWTDTPHCNLYSTGMFLSSTCCQLRC